MNKVLPKILVILGPTASGKTDLSLKIAREFNGEIISADSRQIYKKMSIGTAKPEGKWCEAKSGRVYLVEGVPHYIMDIVDPGKNFTLADFKKIASKHIKDILKRGKLPMIVGGTGLYIESIVDNLGIPKVAPNKKLRKGLEEKELSELIKLLENLDPQTKDNIDLQNKRRVVRALEVVITTGESFVKQKTKLGNLYDSLQLGVSRDREELYDRINQRVDIMIGQGFVEEVQSLVKQKYGWNLSSMSSIGYNHIGFYLKGEMTLDEAINLLKRDTRRYAKKQLSWFRRDKRIKWVNNYEEARELVKKFLK